MAFPEPGISPALLVRASQKARPGLNFGPGRAAGPELCISNQHRDTSHKHQASLKRCFAIGSFNVKSDTALPDFLGAQNFTLEMDALPPGSYLEVIKDHDFSRVL